MDWSVSSQEDQNFQMKSSCLYFKERNAFSFQRLVVEKKNHLVSFLTKPWVGFECNTPITDWDSLPEMGQVTPLLFIIPHFTVEQRLLGAGGWLSG